METRPSTLDAECLQEKDRKRSSTCNTFHSDLYRGEHRKFSPSISRRDTWHGVFGQSPEDIYRSGRLHGPKNI